MHRVKVQPVKAACLACRASKTRCDGQSPCSPCTQRSRGCVYKPSRRGGPRYKHNRKESQDTDMDRSTSSQLSPVSGMGSETSQIDGTSNFANLNSSELFGRRLASMNALLSPASLQPDLSMAPDFLWDPQTSQSPSSTDGPLVRVYTSEREIINAYYTHLHRYLPLLPPPLTPPEYHDRPRLISPPLTETFTVNQSNLPYWPTTSLGLALSAILALIPPPQDSAPLQESNIILRRAFAQLYAQAVLDMVEKEVDAMGQPNTNRVPAANLDEVHADVPTQLYPVLALVVLSIYEYSHRGNIPRMRARANQALTMAMDISIHNLGHNAPEAFRRAWWSTVVISYMSSIAQTTLPVIPTSDPRITTAYPTIKGVSVDPEKSHPWAALVRGVESITSVIEILKMVDSDTERCGGDDHLQLEISNLDSHIVSLSMQTDSYIGITQQDNVEDRAGMALGVIANLLTHSARIRLHRIQAFSNVPLFVEKHCDIDGLMVNGEISLTPKSPTGSSSSPFTIQLATIACLKSSLGVARAFRSLSEGLCPLNIHNSPAQIDKSTIPPTTAAKEISGSLSYFRCAGMQACYSLFMILHQVQAAIASDSLSSCYYLFGLSEPVTEYQDARRLMEEARHGIECMRASLKTDSGFEAIASMSREVDTAYSCFFSN